MSTFWYVWERFGLKYDANLLCCPLNRWTWLQCRRSNFRNPGRMIWRWNGKAGCMTLRGSKWMVMLLKFLPGMTQRKTTSFPLSPPSCRQLPRTSKEYQIRSFAFLHLNSKCSIKCLLRSWTVPDLITAAGTSHLNLSSTSPSPAHRPGANIPFFFLVLRLSFIEWKTASGYLFPSFNLWNWYLHFSYA